MAREPLPDSKRKRLEKLFEVAGQKATAAATPNDFDYVSKLLTECMAGEPGNAYYVQAYLENLQKKYGNNKKGAPLANFKELGARSALKKALAQERWDDAVSEGVKVLAVNPWDTATLVGLAGAAARSGDLDCELCYLKAALLGHPKDPACNRLYALALTKRGLIDQAIVFWRRVEESLPNNEEASRAIASLVERKARSTGKFDEDDAIAKKVKFRAKQQEETSLEQRLMQKIKGDPKNTALLLELAQHYLNENHFTHAEQLLARAHQLAPDDHNIAERLEDCQLRRYRQKIAKAQDPEVRKKLERKYFEKEVEVYQNRIKQYPNNLMFRYELGYRYMKLKRYDEAIQELQAAQNEPRKKGVCLLTLGECFQKIKQYRLAKSHYEQAIQEIPEREIEHKKRALYLAGQLAMYLQDVETAEKHLTALAAMDFTYKDISGLLDKLAELRENMGFGRVQRPKEESESGETTDPSAGE